MSDPEKSDVPDDGSERDGDSPDVPGDDARDEYDFAYEDRIRQFRDRRTGRYVANPGNAA